MSNCIVPLTIKRAKALVAGLHRHHKPPQGALFAIGLAEKETGELVGAVIVGRPVARMSDDGETCEVVRLVTDGTRNACSMLYRAAWRAARSMGWRRLITYTLASEGGASLRGAGFKLLGERGGGSWSRASRPREDKHPTEKKLLWSLEC